MEHSRENHYDSRATNSTRQGQEESKVSIADDYTENEEVNCNHQRVEALPREGSALATGEVELRGDEWLGEKVEIIEEQKCLPLGN